MAPRIAGKAFGGKLATSERRSGLPESEVICC
jgi:hypothetical protein